MELNFGRKGIISTEQDISDPVVNFTVSWYDILIELRFSNLYWFEMHKTIDSTEYTAFHVGGFEYYTYPANLPDPQLYSYNNESKLPVLIIQSEPINIQFWHLSLNQFNKEIETQKRRVEYKLIVVSTIETITKETPLLLLIPSLVVIVITMRYLNRMKSNIRGQTK